MKRPFLFAVVALSLVFCAGLFSKGAATKTSASAQPTNASRSETLDLGAYQRALDDLRSEVEGLSAHPRDTGSLRASLPKTWKVESAGVRFEIATEWLDASLARFESSPAARKVLERDILSRIDQLRADAAAFEAPPNPDRATARVAMAEILRRREYASVRQPSWFELALQRLWRAFWRLIGRLFGRIGAHVNVQRLFAWSLIFAAFVFLAVLLLRVWRQALRSTSLNPPSAPQPAKTWRHWAQEALAQAARGNYRAAVHACYWAGIARLGDLGVWNIDPSRTPREYLRMLDRVSTSVAVAGSSKSPQPAMAIAPSALRASVGALTGTFERVWYAGGDATAGDFRSSIDRLEELGCRFSSTHPTAAS
jgi:hypothetical protein